MRDRDVTISLAEARGQARICITLAREDCRQAHRELRASQPYIALERLRSAQRWQGQVDGVQILLESTLGANLTTYDLRRASKLDDEIEALHSAVADAFFTEISGSFAAGYRRIAS